MNRFLFAFRAFFKVLGNQEFAEKAYALEEQLAKPALPAPKEPEKPKLSTEAVAVLALLQREGRLVDFLMEEVDDYSDDQIGAAARQVHSGCRQALKDYFTFEPVLKDKEGSQVTVPEGYDPSAIQVVGKVTGKAPFRGSLVHHGWRATKAAVPEGPAGADKTVVAAAEVEV